MACTTEFSLIGQWKGDVVDYIDRCRAAGQTGRRGQTPEQALNVVCDRLIGGLANAGIQTRRMGAPQIHDWLLRWFNPRPTMLGPTAQDRERFYRLAAYPEASEPDEIELASGRDFSQRLFFGQPRSDAESGLWYFDGVPHRVMVTDRLRTPPSTGHLTGETRKGDAINTLFDQLPEGTVMCLTLVATPQDVLEAHLNHLAKKAVGETLASEQALQDVQEARSLIGSAHKLYRGSLAFYLSGDNEDELDRRGLQLANVMLNAGLQPVREEDEVAPLNTYLRWLPCVYNPGADRKQWYTQLMFAQHAANLSPAWGRSRGTGRPGITLFNRGGGVITFDPFNRLDRQMNAHLFLFGPTGSGKSATLNNILNQVAAIYRPRMFIVEAGNSFGLLADFAARLGLTVNRVKLAPGSGVSLAPFADARRLIETPSDVQTLDADALDEEQPDDPANTDTDEQRDVLGELDDVPTNSNYLINPYVGTIPPSYPFQPSEREVAEVIEISVADLRNRTNLRDEVRIVDGGLVSRPSYAYRGHLICGATAMVLAQFLGLMDGVSDEEALWKRGGP